VSTQVNVITMKVYSYTYDALVQTVMFKTYLQITIPTFDVSHRQSDTVPIDLY